MRKVLLAAALAGAFTWTAAAAQAQPAPAPAADAPAYSTASSSIGDLLDNPQTKAIVDKYLPNFASNPQVDMARSMTFRAIQTYAADTITDDALAKMDADLAKVPAKSK